MIRDHFRVLTIDLSNNRGTVVEIDGRNEVAGGRTCSAFIQ